MPARDQRGPLGDGPMTGRGMGLCNGETSRRTFFGRRGFKRGGFGRGYGYIESTAEACEIDALKSRIAELEELIRK